MRQCISMSTYGNTGRIYIYVAWHDAAPQVRPSKSHPLPSRNTRSRESHNHLHPLNSEDDALSATACGALRSCVARCDDDNNNDVDVLRLEIGILYRASSRDRSLISCWAFQTPQQRVTRPVLRNSAG